MYLNQNIVYKARIANVHNAYGEVTYGAPLTIKARRQRKLEAITGLGGDIYVSQFEYYVMQEVALDDKLDDRLVKLVEPYVSLGGKTLLYRCLTI